MTLEVAWKKGTRAKIKATIAADELEKIRKDNEGVLRPRDIVGAARAENSPLHIQFTWDDKKAAESWRHEEARYMVRHLVFVEGDKNKEEQGPVFVSVQFDEEDTTERSYVPTRVAMKDSFLREQAIADALKGLTFWKRRYGHLSELSEVFQAIDRVQKNLRSEAI